MTPRRSKALFDILQRNRLLDEKTIDRIAKNVALSGISLHGSLFENTEIQESILNRALAKVYNMRTVEPEQFHRWKPGSVNIRASMAEKYGIVPLARKGKTWVFACADPDDPSLSADLPALLRAPIEFRVVTDVRLAWMLQKAYDIRGNIRLYVLFSRLEGALADSSVDLMAELPTNEVAQKQMILTADGLVEAEAGEEQGELLDEAAFEEFYLGESTPEEEAGEPVGAAVVEDIDEAVLEDAELAGAVIEAPAAEPAYVPQALTREEAIAALNDANTRERLADVLLGFARTQFERAVLLSVDGDHIVGWAGIGEGVSASAVGAIWFPLENESVFQTVCETRSHFLGPLADNAVHQRMFDVLGGIKPAGVFAMPLLYEGNVSQILWLDNGEGQPAGYDISDILILAVRVPAALEALVARAQAELVGD